MPNYFQYQFHNHGGACGAGPAAQLLAIKPAPGTPADPNPNSSILIPDAQLINAQLRLGVYPAGWQLDEMIWRVYSFYLAFGNPPAIGGPPPPVGFAHAPPVGGAGAANLPVSPVAAMVDATEKGQLGYHLGTAAGGALQVHLQHTGPAATTLWFAYHLSRAIDNGGTFAYAGLKRPDIVLFSLDTATNNYHDFVVWENKGHTANHGSLFAMVPALNQARAITHCTTIPAVNGVAAVALVAPWAPAAHCASMVDLYHGNYRVQVIDPPAEGGKPFSASGDQTDAFLHGYYEPFMTVISESSVQIENDDGEFYATELPKGVKIGVDARIVDAYFRSDLKPGEFTKLVSDATSGGYGKANLDEAYTHPTGIITTVNPPNHTTSRIKRGFPRPSPESSDVKTSTPEKQRRRLNEKPPLLGFTLDYIDGELEQRLTNADKVLIWAIRDGKEEQQQVLFDRENTKQQLPLSRKVYPPADYWFVKTIQGEFYADNLISYEVVVLLKSKYRGR